MLKNTPAPRVIFIGGSNLAFGIDGKMVEDSIGVNSVNYGIQAGVGLRLMMEDAMEYSRQGDILVISPEYEHFYGNYHGEKSTLSILTLLYPHIIKRFDAGNYAEMGRGFGDALSVLAMSYFPGDSGNGTSLYKYSSLSFNEYGDESRHWTYPAESITLDRNYIVGEFDESAFDKFLECISLLEDRGVEILIIPPSVYGGFYDRYHNEIDTVDRRLAAEGHPFAIKPEAAVFEGMKCSIQTIICQGKESTGVWSKLLMPCEK